MWFNTEYCLTVRVSRVIKLEIINEAKLKILRLFFRASA